MPNSSKTEVFRQLLEDNCSCSICFEEYKNPKSLPHCCHSFCLKCLQDIHSAGSLQETIVCPLCQQTSQIPKGGIESFPINPVLQDLLEHTPAAEARKCLYGAISECEAQLGKSLMDINTTTTEHITRLNEHVQKQKQIIRGIARKLTKYINKKVGEACIELNNFAARKIEVANKNKQEANLYCQTMESYFKDMRHFVKREKNTERIVKQKGELLHLFDSFVSDVSESTQNLINDSLEALSINQQIWPPNSLFADHLMKESDIPERLFHLFMVQVSQEIWV